MATRGSRYRGGTARYQSKTAIQSIGVRGLKTLSTNVQEEWRQALKDVNRRMKIYLEMREDLTIGTLLDAFKLPLIKAPITIQPAPEQTPGDIQAAEWLDKCLKKMDRQTWRSHVSDCLDSIEFGFAIGEIVLEKRADGRMWLKNIDPRGQETLYGWGWDEENKDIATIFKQQDPNTRAIYEIPLNRCVHVTFRGRKGNPEGKAICDSLYEPYRFLKNFKVMEAIGVERDVGGMPIAKLPLEGDISDDDITAIEKALKGMRNDEAMYLVAPGGVEVSPYGGGSKMYDVGAIIERYEKAILGRLFAQFLKLGMDNVGTQALVQGSQDFFMLALGSIQESIQEAWNQQLVPYIFSFNTFGGMTELPTIEFSQPGKKDMVALLTTLNTAFGMKLYTPTDLDEEYIREEMDLPELPEEEKGMPRDIEAPSPFFEIRKANVST